MSKARRTLRRTSNIGVVVGRRPRRKRTTAVIVRERQVGFGVWRAWKVHARAESCRQFATAEAVGTIGSSCVEGLTSPAFQAPNERVTLALPLPDFLATRTGPWKRLPQQRLSRVNFSR